MNGDPIMSQHTTTQNILNDKVKDWSDFQANLDPDARDTFNRLVRKAQRHRNTLSSVSKQNKSEAAMLALMVEMKREIEDLRDQLELAQVRNNLADELPGVGAVG